MHSPIISVIMPVYNTAKYLNEAIDSILNQTYKDFEFIIIDDCSTDGSLDIIKSYSDERIILIENESNKGIVYGLNLAISFARGKYIARMDSDDISIPTRFEEQIVFLTKNPEVKVCGSFYEIIHSKEIVTLETDHDKIVLCLLIKNSIAHPTVMMEKSFLQKNNLLYDNNLFPSEDYGLWINISRTAKIANLPKVLLMYRSHRNQISKIKQNQQSDIASNLAWENFLYHIRLKYGYKIEFSFLNHTETVLHQIKWLIELNKKMGFNDCIENIILFHINKKCVQLLINPMHRNLKSYIYFMLHFNTLRNAKMNYRSILAYTLRCFGILC